MKKFISKPAALIKFMLLAVLAVSFIACGYDDPKKEREKMAADYYAEDGIARSALIDAETLKSYIDAGYVTPDGKKVLILHVAAQDGALPATTIKGAYGVASDSYVMEARSDGPITDGAMVASGAKMDSFLRAYGIDMNTLVVLTAKSLKNGKLADNKDETHAQMLARAFWTFKYWGFSNNNVKILDGADSYFATLYPTMMEAFRYGMPQPSTFSVKDLPGQRMDIYRAPIGEVLGYAASGALKADGTGSAIMVSTMNAGTPVSKPGLATPETYVIGNSRYIEGRINGETQLALSVNASGGYNNAWNQYIDDTTGKFKTEEELRTLIKGLTTNGTEANSFLPEDKNKRIMFHCITGRTTAPHWFVFKELLGYTNAAIYDGSWQEWTNLAGYVPANVTDTFVNQLDADSKLTKAASDYLNFNGYEFVTSNGAKANVDHSAAMRNLNWDTARFTKFLTMAAPKANKNTYDNEYAGDGREINTEDKNYQAGKGDASAGGNSGGASSGGGSAPAGC